MVNLGPLGFPKKTPSKQTKLFTYLISLARGANPDVLDKEFDLFHIPHTPLLIQSFKAVL